MIRRMICLVCLLLLPSLARAQRIDSLVADEFVLKNGPCAENSGDHAPEGVETGRFCDKWRDNTTGKEYFKIAGAGTSTGWMTWTNTNTALSIMSRSDTNAVGISQIETTGTLSLSGFPTRTIGGGFHVGNAGITDPGLGNSAFDGYVGEPGYVSQLSKWRITPGGAADFRYIYSDELRVKLFTADLESVLAGSQRVVKSFSTLSKPFTCPAYGVNGTLWVKDAPTFGDAQIFEVGDAITIRNMTRIVFGPFEITDCVGIVNAYVDGATGSPEQGMQAWNFVRNAVATGGAMTPGTVVAVDQLAQDLGTSGSGYVETSAVDGPASINAPYTQVVTWTTAPVSANLTARARLGNLRGITGTDGEYGLIAGTYSATNGRYFKCGSVDCALHGIDLFLWDGANPIFQVRRNDGHPYLSIGNPATNVFTGPGAFLGWSGSVAQFSLYSNASNYFFFDGTKLAWSAANTTLDSSGNLTATSATLSGSVTAGSGAIGGWVLGSTFFYDAAGSCGLSSAVTGGNDIRIWCGNATLASAPFRVYENGAVVMTSATITGNFTATGGDVSGALGANSITTTMLDAGSVTAAKLSVSTLSAITANLGTVTAGSISGVSISGITLTGGSLNISTGGSISSGGSFLVNASGNIFAPTGTIGTFTATDIVMPGRGGAGTVAACFDSSGNLVRGGC